MTRPQANADRPIILMPERRAFVRSGWAAG
jgi:hypothetical protein